ncbi:PREDICTED: uncharacterized protein LOC107065472 isoform X2 [Polistes dominula]|nr:PREDICTED: uncharacterized protein LOC107065472 isoform X2 [Polistes dominula]
MYALCILAAINLRQHVQQNWQINSTSTKRIPSHISLNLLKCNETNNVPRKIENLRKDLKNNVEINNENNDQTIWQSSWFYFRKVIKGPRQIFNNISESFTNSKTTNSPLSKNIYNSVLFFPTNS